MSLFGTKEKEEIARLTKVNEDLKQKVKDLVERRDELVEDIKEKDEKIKKIKKSPHDKQLEKVTLVFDKVKMENTKLIEENKELKEKLEELKKIKTNEPLGESKYKILVKDLYSARKHDEFRKICEVLEVIYVSDLENFDFDKLIEEGYSKVKIANAKELYQEFKDGDLDSTFNKYLVYGHKISKIFFRYRSFVNYLSELKINYVSQLDEFDFEKLDEDHFTSTQVKKLKDKLKTYNNLRKI